MLQVKDDNGAVTPATIDEVLAWGCWSTREVNKIYAVATGQLRRFSTSRNGVPCDIERRA